MELQKKTIVCLGDSITQGCGSTDEPKKGWVGLLQNLNPTAKVLNHGVGGTRIARKRVPTVPAIYDEDFIKRADELPEKADIVLIFGGTNDYGHGDAAMGKPEDTDVYTFYGALNTLFTKLITKYPLGRIVVLTPTHRADENEIHTFSDGKFVLIDFVRAIREVAENYSLPVLDLYKMSGFFPSITAQKELLMPDGLHPNDLGYEKLVQVIDSYLKSL